MNSINTYFEVKSCLNKKIRITKNHWEFIITEKHLEIRGKENKVKLTIIQPEIVRISQEGDNIYLYYRKFGKYYLCVVARHLNGEGFIITIYFTDKIKEGEVIWKK